MRPWMHPVEVEQVFPLARGRCLEWGSGGSTVELLTRPGVTEVVSVEHDHTWWEVMSQIKDTRLQLHHVPSNVPGLDEGPGTPWAEQAELDASVLADYVVCPQGLFDFILVDGRARCFCLLRGRELLAPGGVMVLHDAQREAYRDVLRVLKAELLEPWYQGQVAVIR